MLCNVLEIKYNIKDVIKIRIIRKIILMFVILIVLICAIIYGISYAFYNGNVKLCLVNIISKFTIETKTKYILVMGVSEDISTELTDTMMIIGYNPDSQKAFLVSIPRDTFVGKVKLVAKGSDKINSKYSKDISESVKSAGELSGIEIDNYIVVKTSVLRKIVDTIGGVKFDVPIDMDYDDPTQDLHIHLKKGEQLLDGDKAEQLLRFRHNNDGSSYPAKYGDNDFGRMKTGREFIKTAITQASDYKNIFKIKSILDTVSDNLITDLSKDEIIAYCIKLAAFDSNNLETDIVPGNSKTLNGLSFYLADEDKTKEMFSGLVEKIK